MRRVEDVLGRGWENHVEGQKLKSDGDSFRMKLNTQEIFDDWARKVIFTFWKILKINKLFHFEILYFRFSNEIWAFPVEFLPLTISGPDLLLVALWSCASTFYPKSSNCLKRFDFYRFLRKYFRFLFFPFYEKKWNLGVSGRIFAIGYQRPRLVARGTSFCQK